MGEGRAPAAYPESGRLLPALRVPGALRGGAGCCGCGKKVEAVEGAMGRERREAPPPPQTAPQYGCLAAPRGKGGAAPRPPPPPAGRPASRCVQSSNAAVAAAAAAARPPTPRPRPSQPRGLAAASRAERRLGSPSRAGTREGGAAAPEPRGKEGERGGGGLLPGRTGLELSPMLREEEPPNPELGVGPPPPLDGRKLETPAGARKLTEGVSIAPKEEFFPEGIQNRVERVTWLFSLKILDLEREKDLP